MWTAIKALLSPFKVELFGVALFAFALWSAFLFTKGADYNEAKHIAASAKFQAEFNKAQYDDLFEIAQQSQAATEAYQKTEALNDQIEAGLLRPLTIADGCIDAGWLRGLDKLH